MNEIDISLINEIKEKGKCKDNFIGNIERTIDCQIKEDLHFSREKREEFKNRDKLKSSNINNIKNIIIVLESPHKEEFNKSNSIIAPALGQTGRNLQNKFKEIFKEDLAIQKEQIYRILLMNAIQYQCSNGESLEKYRNRTDKVWKWFWNNGGKDSFSDRISSYNPSIVINACTGNIGKQESIKYILQECINNNCYNSKLYKAPHPSSCWFKKGYVIAL